MKPRGAEKIPRRKLQQNYACFLREYATPIVEELSTSVGEMSQCYQLQCHGAMPEQA